MGVFVLYNPVCGDGTAKDFFAAHVLPLLEIRGKTVDEIVETNSKDHAGVALHDYLQKSTPAPGLTIILGSGDGTLHDFLDHPLPRIHFVLIPCGTANALYSSLYPPSDTSEGTEYKLQSLYAYLNNEHGIPLSIAITTISPPPNDQTTRPRVVVSVVVCSTSLHASILHDSESLRAEMPGIERFKVAAKANSTKWYNSTTTLLPMSGKGIVQIYDHETRMFVNHPESTFDDPVVEVDGPFVYFLSAINVDRLEPHYKIAPLLRSSPPSEACCEVIMIRPLRSPKVDWDTEETREAFVDSLWTTINSPYNDGTHITLRYNEDGEIVSEGNGTSVVEYVRCGGWNWVPYDIDDSAHILCSDGDIEKIERGGRAVCIAVAPKNNSGFSVY
ncbi:ATP-NAD kinase-like domain-containing protein [Cyathus striatus]|nr:ATP-NAD kinase-like domain-containing protein [Cyathus striatus]